jgi:heavy metal sensor kinase
MRRSIRLRLTAWYTGALALTLVALGCATYLITRSGLYHWLDESIEERVEALSEEVRVIGGRPSLAAPEQRRGIYEGADDGFLIADGSGAVAAARGLDAYLVSRSSAMRTALLGIPSNDTVATRGGRRWRLSSHPLVSQGRVTAVIVVGHNLDEVDEVLGRMALTMGALLPLALLIAGAGGFALATRALSPVDRITRAAAAISERDLSQRLPVISKDEIGRLARTFNGMIERLERAFERQRRFTADASHELRTPLSIIRAITSQKLMRHREPGEYEAALRQIDDAAGYMARLVGHLLALARADAGDAPLELESLDLTELLGHVAGQVGEVFGRTIPVVAAGPVRITGDPLRLTELFLNLLENAAKYTAPEGTIGVQVSDEGSEAVVAVRDTGIGVAPEHLPHIFERFYRVDKARTRDEGGTGLGLAIAHWIAAAHHGSIQAASEPGRGTTMTVRLPAGDSA